MLFVTVGGNATFLPQNAPNWPNIARNATFMPFCSRDPRRPGYPFYMTESVAPGSDKSNKALVRYFAYFRPDSMFHWKEQEVEYPGD
jgi:hypothetical protein